MARVNTKQLITEAAVRVAAQHGISGASMDQIAEAAGVAKGSLYYNFASKDAIFEEVIRVGFEKLAAAIDGARAAVAPADAPRAVAAATLETLRGNLDLAKLMASEVFRTDRPWADTMALARGSVTVRFRDVLRAAREANGDPRSAETTETAGAAFFGALAGACLDWLLFREDQPVELVLDQVLEAF
ncbi:TetR/AcrR family transcriptional regulator [Leucobacter chromiireducens]|uniref:TetR/AcrR family transcriptional regulator n=1 Tax=Leucobacter chromiireducens TaxID=283877 RepID=UPI000F63688A|nr:TetR/AcrR family transcriptional regulator [Leucobacter chromiireducens]